MKKRSLLPHHVLFLLLGLSDLLRDGNSSEHWSSSLSSFMPPSFVAEAFAPPNSIPAYNKWATATTTTTTTSRHSQVTPTTPTSDLDFNGDGDEDNNDDDSSWLSFFEDQVDDSALSADSSSEDSVSALRSITFSNIRKDQEPQLLCNFLMELGACSTYIVDADRGTERETAIFHEPGSNIDHTPTTNSVGTTTTAVTTHVWNCCNVSATFTASTDLQWIWDIVQESFPNTIPDDYVVSVVDETKDWVLHVQQSWKPIVLPPFVLKFPWHTKDTIQEAIDSYNQDKSRDHQVDDDMVELLLQGGIAFGTGEHPTTQLCLDWIADVLHEQKSDVDDEAQGEIEPMIKLMDYGTGSGVLGIAACMLRPKGQVEAIGVDIDIDAVYIANANAQENDVNMISYLSDLVVMNDRDEEGDEYRNAQDAESKSILMRSSASNKVAAFSSKPGQQADVLPNEYNGPIYDICVANILAGPLCTLSKTLYDLVKPNSGRIGLSGIMSSQKGMIIEEYTNAGFTNVRVDKEQDNWVLITGEKN